ncbi:hypothetical protein DZC75_10720 [Pseudomonas parafulva]|uniref:Uncharacterized protein n=1 Tax=Pseudomonas parafulva TaxID=157782 RepID=A0AAI8KBC5_9PSED|nr:hypothetical protein [Pseudomonas parafulva]AXO88446.1 hypothetical protein DZC75_10720 [Pseudomonas parafulva]
MSKTLHGTAKVQVGDRTLVLKPTLKAVRFIESRFGGLRAASQSLHAVSVDAVALVIAAGAGVEGEDIEAFTEEVWQQGAAELTPAATAFLSVLYNPRGGDAGKEQAEKESAP